MRSLLLTVSGLAREAEVSESSVRAYARKNLIPHTIDSAGRRLFDAGAIPAVRSLHKRHVTSRGRRPT
jgi:DNA-binding transcriptional MerR regulator